VSPAKADIQKKRDMLDSFEGTLTSLSVRTATSMSTTQYTDQLWSMQDSGSDR